MRIYNVPLPHSMQAYTPLSRCLKYAHLYLFYFYSILPCHFHTLTLSSSQRSIAFKMRSSSIIGFFTSANLLLVAATRPIPPTLYTYKILPFDPQAMGDITGNASLWSSKNDVEDLIPIDRSTLLYTIKTKGIESILEPLDSLNKDWLPDWRAKGNIPSENIIEREWWA